MVIVQADCVDVILVHLGLLQQIVKSEWKCHLLFQTSPKTLGFSFSMHFCRLIDWDTYMYCICHCMFLVYRLIVVINSNIQSYYCYYNNNRYDNDYELILLSTYRYCILFASHSSCQMPGPGKHFNNANLTNRIIAVIGPFCIKWPTTNVYKVKSN